jgi:GH15 family glucan-1,4-alpha-glucosidase
LKETKHSLKPVWRKITPAYLDGYKPIRDYALIGDQKTCALVGIDASIDWLCVPRFDSPSVFAAILDKNKGGSFRIIPLSEEFETRQFYEDNTNILLTQFKDSSGLVQILDFMPCFRVSHTIVSAGEIHRRIQCLEGEFQFGISIKPRMNYGLIVPNITKVGKIGYSFTSSETGSHELSLMTPFELEFRSDSLSGSRKLSEGKSIDLVLSYGGARLQRGEDFMTDLKLNETRAYWKKWAAKCQYTGRWKEHVVRSALALKLLVYSPTGAVVAAPTTSLPEEIHGKRNWDYRYSWIRDSSFVLWAFHSIGHDEAVEPYLEWIMNAFYLTAQNMQVMIGIGGERDLTERILGHLEGYNSSAPVRIGNGAYNQLQLDLYGILVDSLYFSHLHGKRATKKVFEYLIRPVVKIVGEVWDTPDCGIWEVRGGMRNFVYSKVWCWVAIDRSIRIAKSLGITRDIETWVALRDRIRNAIFEKGWNGSIRSFVQSYGSNDVDSANLLMPQLKFIDGKDPKMIATIRQIEKSLMTGGKYLYRYKTEDGLPGDEGAFLICSFWLVSCLTLAGKLKEAERLLDSLLDCANHVGLFSEEIDPRDGSMLGNFPQAFSHMGFITAVTDLEKVRNGRA